MSGHSKWSTIKRAKGAADIKRGLTFTKVANAITIAVKTGGSGNPEDNPRLRVVIEEAKTVNMPKENIQRAIERGLGKLPGQVLEEVTYEGFGPGKVAYIVEGVTDNRLRTLQEVKNIFERGGGSLAGQGSVAYMFKRVGEIKVRGKGGSKDSEMLELIDLGAEDVEDYLEDSFDGTQDKNIQRYLVNVKGPELNTMGNKITQAGYGVEQAEIVYKPGILVEVKDPEAVKKVLEFTDKLEELDDIQKVYANFDVSDNLLEERL